MARTANIVTDQTTAPETGLLTRCVPASLKTSFLYKLFLRFTRIFQLFSSSISLGLFSSRIYKVYRLFNNYKNYRGINGASKAVETILAAATVYTLFATLFSLVLRGKGPTALRWLWVLLDLLFVGAFIAVAVLTRPNGGTAGPHHCYANKSNSITSSLTGQYLGKMDPSCNLPWGTFALAIFSAVLHAITACFNEVKSRRQKRKQSTYSSDQSMAQHEPSNKINGHATDAGFGTNSRQGVSNAQERSYVQGNGNIAADYGKGSDYRPHVGTERDLGRDQVAEHGIDHTRAIDSGYGPTNERAVNTGYGVGNGQIVNPDHGVLHEHPIVNKHERINEQAANSANTAFATDSGYGMKGVVERQVMGVGQNVSKDYGAARPY